MGPLCAQGHVLKGQVISLFYKGILRFRKNTSPNLLQDQIYKM